jgi:hypothetical protein
MILKSWKEIANHLHCGVRTAQRWEQEFGLPIRRPPDRNVVLAISEELDEWVTSAGTNSVTEDARDKLMGISELRQELAELRLRQRELATRLRACVNIGRESAKKRNGKNMTTQHASVALWCCLTSMFLTLGDTSCLLC